MTISCAEDPERAIDWDKTCDGLLQLDASQENPEIPDGKGIIEYRNKGIRAEVLEIPEKEKRGVGDSKPGVLCVIEEVRGDGERKRSLTIDYRISGKEILRPVDRRSSLKRMILGGERDYYFEHASIGWEETRAYFSCRASDSQERDRSVEVLLSDDLLDLGITHRIQILATSVERQSRELGCVNEINVADIKDLSHAPMLDLPRE